MNKIIEQIIRERGFSEEELRPEYGFSGAKLPGVERAAERIIQAARNGEKVLIYGDYDVDGVTASAIMEEVLKLAGVQEVFVMLPDRFLDGYGMSMRAVERAKELGVGLVVTVDCGSSNAEVVSALAEAGIETIVTDHHEATRELPKCIVVNGKVGECGSLRELCGAGTAFMVGRELVERGAIPAGQEKWLLDLVYIGTVADSMRMRGVNRMLGRYGRIVLAKTRRKGLKEILRLLRLTGEISTEEVGFMIGPRLNAAGRMKNPEIAYRLLTAESDAEAVKLAQELNDLNKERRAAQEEAILEVSERVAESKDPVIVVRGEWHEGVIGIIAGKLQETFRKPTFVLTTTGEGVLKGSGRSFGDFNLAEALVYCKDLFLKYGGHAGACGMSLVPENFEAFSEKVNEYYKSLGLVEQEKFLERKPDVVLSNFSELTEELVADLDVLEPFGPGNEEPIFQICQAKVLEVKKMGREENHLRLWLEDGEERRIAAVKFYASSEELAMPVGAEVEILGRPVMNEFNGQRSVELRPEKIVLKNLA